MIDVTGVPISFADFGLTAFVIGTLITAAASAYGTHQQVRAQKKAADSQKKQAEVAAALEEQDATRRRILEKKPDVTIGGQGGPATETQLANEFKIKLNTGLNIPEPAGTKNKSGLTL